MKYLLTAAIVLAAAAFLAGVFLLATIPIGYQRIDYDEVVKDPTERARLITWIPSRFRSAIADPHLYVVEGRDSMSYSSFRLPSSEWQAFMGWLSAAGRRGQWPLDLPRSQPEQVAAWWYRRESPAEVWIVSLHNKVGYVIAVPGTRRVYAEVGTM